MEISKRVFPYPVLSDFTNDYKNSYFYNHIKTDFDVDKLIVTINCKLKNEQLNDLLNNQKLKIVHHFENSSTAFRRVYETFDLEFECSLSKKDVSGRMSIVSFLIVNEYISNYRNNDFVDILIGYTYDFDVGTTLGIAQQYDVDVEMNKLDILDRESIFTIIRNVNVKESTFEVELIGNKIVIKISEEDYSNLSEIKSIQKLQTIINSLLVVPVLINVMHTIFDLEPDEREVQYDNKGWYKAIRRAFNQIYKIDINSTNIDKSKILSYSQKLVGTPISDSLETLKEHFSIIESED